MKQVSKMTICLQSQYKLEKQSLGPNLMEATQNNITSLAQLQQLRLFQVCKISLPLQSGSSNAQP